MIIDCCGMTLYGRILLIDSQNDSIVLYCIRVRFAKETTKKWKQKEMNMNLNK